MHCRLSESWKLTAQPLLSLLDPQIDIMAEAKAQYKIKYKLWSNYMKGPTIVDLYIDGQYIDSNISSTCTYTASTSTRTPVVATRCCCRLAENSKDTKRAQREDGLLCRPQANKVMLAQTFYSSAFRLLL
jgi:hypothetical protein